MLYQKESLDSLIKKKDINMALILNEEQQSLKDIARDFLEKNAPITHF